MVVQSMDPALGVSPDGDFRTVTWPWLLVITDYNWLFQSDCTFY